MTSPSVCQAVFHHFEDFADSVPGTSLVVTPIVPALFSAELALLRFNGMVLTVGRCTPLMFTGCLSGGSGRIVLPLEKIETLRLNGLVVRAGDVAVFRPGADYDGAWADDACWASLALPPPMLKALLKAPPGSRSRRHGTHVVLRARPEIWSEVASLIKATRQVVLEDPQALAGTEAVRGLEADLLEALRELLSTDEKSDGAKVHARVAGRQHIVRRFEDALLADDAQVLRAGDLCAAIGVAPSRLKAAIEASFGMEPERYLQLRRLARAHCAAPAPARAEYSRGKQLRAS